MAVDTREEQLFIFIVPLKVRRAAGAAEPKGLTRRTIRGKEHRKYLIQLSTQAFILEVQGFIWVVYLLIFNNILYGFLCEIVVFYLK